MVARSSSPVRSSQPGSHHRLEETVRRHLASPWKEPLHRPTVAAFAKLVGLLDSETGEWVLDSGCGNGLSTLAIAQRHPQSLVIGIDQSLKRLQRQGDEGFPLRKGNAIFIQAELATFWRLALEAGHRTSHHYILYPNPWPKPGQLKRRWHAHPVFPRMLALGGQFEMRCNWKIYAEEFCAALKIARPGLAVTLDEASSESAWDGVGTPFGRKYANSGHRLYRLRADLDA